MTLSNNTSRRAVRTLYVEFISLDGRVVKFDLWLARRQLAFYIAVSIDHPAIQEFADPDGSLIRLSELIGGTARFYVDGFTSDGYFELSNVLRIKKVVDK